MKTKKLLLLLIFIGFWSNAQVLDEYPQGQYFYEGGVEQFYKEVNEYLVSSNFKECDSKEIYQPRIIVTKDAEIKIIKDGDEDYIAKNKCTYDASVAILKNLKGWKPAQIHDKNIGAISEFLLNVKDVMSNYKPNYNPHNYIIPAQYPKGFKAFDKDFHDNFMALFQDYGINGNVNLEFYISREGKIINARMYPTMMNQDFNKDFMRSLARLKKVWKPALYSNMPIKERIAFPVGFSTRYTPQ